MNSVSARHRIQQANSASSLPVLIDMPRPLRLFLWASIGLTLAALLFTLLVRHLGYGLPYSNPFYYVPGDRFGDFQGFKEKFKSFGQPDFFTVKEGYFMYPAPMVYVFRVFLISNKLASKLFVAFMLIVFASLIKAFTSILRKAGWRGRLLTVFVTGVVLLSYPIIFVLMRWNIEVLIFLLTSLGIWTFWRKQFYRAAFYFGLATALKFFPLIFFGLLFARKRYRETTFGICVAVLITVLALKSLGPSVAQAFAWDNLQMSMFRVKFAGIPSALGYDHSCFGFIKWLLLSHSHDLTSWVTPYTRVAALTGLALYFARIYWLPRMNQILCTSILAVTLAPTSYDYTLLSLYPAFLLLSVRTISQARNGLPYDRLLDTLFLLFAVAFTPLSFVVWNGGRYAGQFRFLTLFAMLLLTLVIPIGSDMEDEDLPSAPFVHAPAF